MKIEKFIFNPFHENTYLVYDEVTKDAVVIDCGCYTQKEKNTLLSFINQHQLTIKYVLNTHLHIDHIFGNKFLFSQFGIEPQAHKGDIELLERMQELALAFGLSLKEKEQSIGNFIVDFYCAKARLVVELDGGGHFLPQEIQLYRLKCVF